ncbi:hypothetical protein RN001_010858 [Aquatica leii]|uniref:Invertebrate defensins family profile domain-containing protein n=1 Tax=Aquatica leii TaxID=1421715 RepID=A0AAN7P766_9COLE|nr:hypothetical protein RN001_010858 [Aquatica leii]
MNKIFLCFVIVSFVIAFVAAQPVVVEEGGLNDESIIREKRAASCRSVASQPNKPSTYNESCRAHCILNGKKGAAQPVVQKDGVYVESLSNLREKREMSCRSVSTNPGDPGSYDEGCRAYCIMSGRKGGSCSGTNCSCY